MKRNPSSFGASFWRLLVTFGFALTFAAIVSLVMDSGFDLSVISSGFDFSVISSAFDSFASSEFGVYLVPALLLLSLVVYCVVRLCIRAAARKKEDYDE